MTQVPNVSKHSFRWQFNVGTLLMMTALCGSVLSFSLARANRLRLTSKMNALAELEGSPPIADVTIYRLQVKNAGDDMASLWIPRHGRIKLCWTTSMSEEGVPKSFESVELGEGRHSLAAKVQTTETIIELDDLVIFRRQHTPAWNLAQDTYWEQTGDVELNLPNTVILSGFGVATLRSDEAFDPEKHRFGLKIWLER